MQNPKQSDYLQQIYCNNYLQMEEEGFRISVCLKLFYNDRRSRAYISVIPKNKVHWLHQRLRTLFGLEGHFFLRSRGHLLHPDEPLSLLRPDDPVEVVPLPKQLLEVGGDKTRLNGLAYSQTQENLQSLPYHETNQKEQIKEVPLSQEDVSDDKLLEMKQKALVLLHQYREFQHYEDEPDGIPVPTAPLEVPKRRRRVRRRKRRTSNEESSNNGDLLAPVEKQITEIDPPAEETQISSIGPRKPRLVRSLSPS